MLFIIGVYVVMGMFMETLSMMVLTVPLITPVVVSLGYNPVWFGVLVVLLCEMAILTPPIGVLCYVIQGLRKRGTLNDVFIGVTPFILAIAVMLGIMLLFPELALYLPQMFYR